MSDEQDAAFNKIMGLGAMPPDDSPDYDRWLFDETWQAAIQAERERLLKLAEEIAIEVGGRFADTHSLNIGLNEFRKRADAIRRGEGV